MWLTQMEVVVLRITDGDKQDESLNDGCAEKAKELAGPPMKRMAICPKWVDQTYASPSPSCQSASPGICPRRPLPSPPEPDHGGVSRRS